MNLGQKSEIPGLHFCANMKLRTQPAILVNHWLFLIGMSSMYENYHCFKFDDVTLTCISGHVITFASNFYQIAAFSYLEDILKTMVSGQLVSAAMFHWSLMQAQENDYESFGCLLWNSQWNLSQPLFKHPPPHTHTPQIKEMTPPSVKSTKIRYWKWSLMK